MVYLGMSRKSFDTHVVPRIGSGEAGVYQAMDKFEFLHEAVNQLCMILHGLIRLPPWVVNP